MNAVVERIRPASTAKAGPTAIVVGSGFGGLALAIRLQSAGIRTTLVEKRDKPGGRAYVYEDQGFTFDAGPTVITDPTALEELFDAAGKSMADYVELLPVTPFYQLRWEDGFAFDYANDQAELDRQIGAKSPKDVEGYRRFLAYSREVFREGYEKLGTVPFLNFRDMVKAGPQLARLQAWRSVYAKVAEFIEDEQLQAGLFLPLAARRRQSLRHLVDLRADPCAGARMGRLVPARRHRRAGSGHGEALHRHRRHDRIVRRSRPHRS